MTVLLMEPLVIRGRRPALADPAVDGPVPTASPARTPLTNRAAGLLRDSPDRARFGGFAYTRTAQDDAEVAAAIARSRRAATGAAPSAAAAPGTETSTPGDAGAGPAGGPAPAALPGAPTTPTQTDAAEAATPDEGPSLETSATGAPTTAPVAPTAASAVPPAPGPAASGAPPTAPATAPRPTGIETPAALVAAAQGAADALPHPGVPRAPLDRVFAPLVATAGTHASRPMPRGGGGRYPPPRPVEPIEIDPVPDATATLSSALNERLPELALPALRAMPDGTAPTLPEVRGVGADELATVVNLDAPAADAADVNACEASRRRDAARPAPDAAVPVPAAVPVSPPVLVDVRPRPPDPLPPASAELETQQVTRVLALVTANVDERAQQLIDSVRDQAFPPHKLANEYLELTNPTRDRIRDDLQAKLGELREAAGITAEALTAAVSARRTELENRVAHVATEAELEAGQAAATLTREAERENAHAEAQRLRDQARQVARYRRALHSRDPALVEELVTARLGYIEADMGRGTTSLDTAKARRLELIGQYDTAYHTAYRTADDAFQHPAGGGARAPPNDASGRLWYDVALDALTTSMTGLRTQTENDWATLANTIRDAGLAAKAAVRAWSDTRLRRTLSDDARVARTTADIDATNTAVTNARAQAARDATRGRLVSEIRFAAATALRTADDANEVSREHMITLTADQLDAGRHFLAAGDPGDPMSAVANNLVATYAREHLRDEPESIRTAVYAKVANTPEEAARLGEVYFPGGGVELGSRVTKLWDAFEVWHGTAEEDAIAALSGLDPHATALLNRDYFLTKGQSLRWRIGDEMSGSDYDQAMGLARGDAEGRQMHARGVIADSHGFFSNDPARALDAIRNLPPGEASAVVSDPDTAAHLSSVLGGSRWVDRQGSITDDRGARELDLLVQINAPARASDPNEAARRRDLQARADAIEFDRAVRRGTGGEASTETVMNRIRASVTASAPDTWSDAEIDNEVRRRVRAMENAYETEFGSELPTTGVSALRTAVARYSYGTTLDLRQALLDVDRSRERASRLQRTTEGLYTSDSEMNTELTTTYNDALAEVRRNRARQEAVEARARRLMADDGITSGGRTPAPAELAAYRQEAEEVEARSLAGEWMSGVSSSFSTMYGRRWGGGADPLRDMITSETQFAGETEALARYDNGGGLTAAQSVEIGQAGWGMDRSMVLAGLGNRTTQQLGRISADYRTNTHGGDMLADLRSETGSWTDATPDTRLERDAFDIREAMRGVPTTSQQTYDAARRRFEYERDVYFGGASGRPSGLSDQFASLQRQMDRADALRRDLDAANASGDTAAARRIEYGLDAARANVGVAADNYRHAVDEHVEGVAQKVAIAVALAVVVIAAAVTTILTGGLAAPAWVAVATAVGASVAGTAASMGVKAYMLRSAYGQNAIRTDLAVGAVDAIVAALTAGLGDKLMRLRGLAQVAGAGTAAARTLASRALAAERAARPLWQRMAAFGAEQVAQAVPTALTGAALNRDTWRGDPLRNFLSAGGMAAGMAIGLGTVMHHTMPHITGGVTSLVEAGRMRWSGSGAHISADSVTLASARSAAASGDVEGAANRGSWGERGAARREFLRANPGATDGDFEIALMNGGIDTRARAEAVAASLPDMRAHLVSGLSGADAELAAHARIEVLSDAEFFARTGSESNGYAATLNVRGEPVVVVREGTPLTRLAEEGRHVAQFFDPANASRLALITEGRLGGYADLSVPERIAAWQAKIDLELEVQNRAIPELRGRLADPNLPPERALDLGRMLAEAEQAAEVLSARRAHLSGLDVVDVARMASGELPEPRWLADEPRLFAKDTGPPPLAPDPLDIPNSTLEELPGGRVREIGAPFSANGKTYRFARILAADGTILDTFIERRTGASWSRSGRGNRPRGGIAELAERMERAPSLGRRGDTSRVAFDAQVEGQGSGFDNVVLTFTRRADGTIEAAVQIVEVKSYFENTVNNFGAVSGKFDQNVARLRQRLQAHLDGLAHGSGMSDAQLRAAIGTIDRRRIDVEIRVTEGTRVTEARLDSIRSTVNAKSGSDVRVTLDPTPISFENLTAAARYWDALEGYRLLGPDHPDYLLFRSLANGPSGMSPGSIQAADAVIAGRNARPPLVRGGVTWSADRTHLIDADGPFVVVTPSAEGSRNVGDLVATAADAVERARTRIGGADVRVILDDMNLSSAQARYLHEVIRLLARGDKQVLGRISSMGLSGPLP